MKLIFLGPPGAGKGTQAQTVCHALAIPQVSTGDMLRSAIASHTPTGEKAKAFMDAGQLVPDEVVIAIVQERLAMDDCQNGYVLDGFPRTVQQAKALDAIANIQAVVNLDVEDDVIVTRLSGRRVCPSCGAPYHVDRLNGGTTCKNDGETLVQRADDCSETVLSRLQVYHQKTAPLIDYYQEKGLLHNIAGNVSPEEISQTILKTLEEMR